MDIKQRDSWVCKYCGLDGKESFANWRALTDDHLLPHGHPLRDDAAYCVTACGSCNMKLNQFFKSAEGQAIPKTAVPEDLVEVRRKYLTPKIRELYEEWLDQMTTHAKNHTTPA